jgi:hypothetical protein
MTPPLLQAPDLVGPFVAALVFVLAMSRLREPVRQRFNAILVAGASAAYLNGGLGMWELVYPALGAVVAYRGLSDYRWIGVGWWLHTGWDVLHHLYGRPIWEWMPTSSAGCAVFDVVIGMWFFAGAPTIGRLALPPFRR